jgi:diguanylate cyclase (GGDEF)-like protein
VDERSQSRAVGPSGAGRWQPVVIAVAAVLGGTAAYLATSGHAQQLVYHCLSLTSAAFVWWGVRLHRPEHVRPWLLVACGLVVMTAADVSTDALQDGLPVPAPLPVLLYVAAWGLLVHAVRSLAKHRVPDGDGDAVLDAVAVVVALALVLWGVVLEPVRDAAASATASLTVAAFPLAQVALLALYLRLLFAGGPRVIASWVLCLGGGVCGLIGSTAYVVLVASGTYRPGAWNNLFWIAAYAAPGIAALLPDMREVTRPVGRASDVSMARWTVLAGALLATTAVTSFRPAGTSAVLVLVTALPVPVIVLWRLFRVLRSRQDAVHRAQLESARNALVARLAAGAVTGDVAALRDTACEELARELGCEVGMAAHAEAPAGPGVLAVPVGPVQDATQVLEVRLPSGRTWSGSDDAVVHSVANVLAAAESRHRSEELVRWAAGHDGLTGLPNRSTLMSALAEAVVGAPPGGVAVLFLDLDGFKQVNDGHGHTAGDAVLIATAGRLRAACREDDLVARLGGDEFVLLCRAPSACSASEGLADRIRDAVTQPVRTHVGVVQVGVSVGIAVNRVEDQPEDVLRRADELMYQGKHRRAGDRRGVPARAAVPAQAAVPARGAVPAQVAAPAQGAAPVPTCTAAASRLR